VQAGARLLAFSVVILLVAPISGRLSDRYGSRWFMTFGPLLAATGLALLLRTTPESSYIGVLLPAFLVLAAGMAMTMSPMTAAVMASVETRHAGVASAATNTSREIGGVFGIALLGAIVTAAFNRAFLARLVGAGFPRGSAQLIVSGASARSAAGGATVQTVLQQSPPGTTTAQAQSVVQAVHSSFVHAMHTGILVAVGVMLVAALVSALFVRSHVTGHGEEFEHAPAMTG
jgi:MFS family permease